MSTCIQANHPAALSERLEALASQLAELEQLRDRVGREENRQRELRKSPRPSPDHERRCNSVDVKLMPLRGRKWGSFNEHPKADG